MKHLDLTLPTLAENLALEEALLLEAEANQGPALLRFWELDHLAVVLGASGRFAEDLRLENCQADRVEIGRRSSGGGTVVIGPGALNLSIFLPIGPDLKQVDEAQRIILERVARAIRREGPPVELRGSGDLTLDSRKFSGSAQRRLRNHLLVHASLLYDFPIDRIDRYTRMPARRPTYREDRPHSEFVTNLPVTLDRLKAAIRSEWLEPSEESAPVSIPESLVRTLVETKFANNEWISRL